MKNRKGFIKLDKYLFDELLEDDNKVLELIFSRFFPIRIEPDFRGSIYWGYSQEFDEIPEATVIPQYDCIVTRHDNNEGGVSYTVKFEKL